MDPSLRVLPARVLTAAFVVALGWAAGAAGLPSSYRFAALVAGVLVALVRPDAVGVPAWAFSAGRAATGVVLGTYLRSCWRSRRCACW